MAKMKFANNANTTLASSLTAIATSMSVTSATKFPVLNPLAPVPEYFYCTLTDVATQTVIEIVKVTATSGTTWTITRGQDGTTGTAFAAGDTVSLRLVRASLDDFPKLDEANTFTDVLTASGGVVGNVTGNVSGSSGSCTGNASTVTTNANLTGPITSVGNATSIASQTGTGSKFVVDTSPTLVTPTATTTIGVGGATPSASGAGITFPATQSASTDANTLDDYEKGTFTPTGLDQSGHAFPSYTTQVGFYTKVGNLVTIRLRMRTGGSTVGMTTTQMLKIGGLPFSVIDTQGSLVLATTVGLVALAPSVYLNVVAYNAGSGGTALDIYAIGGDVVTPYGETQFTVANFESGSGAYINITGTYFTT